MSKKNIQGFLFELCKDSSDERDFHGYDFQLNHIDSLNWCSYGIVTECVCCKRNPALNLNMKKISCITTAKSFEKLCLDKEWKYIGEGIFCDCIARVLSSFS